MRSRSGRARRTRLYPSLLSGAAPSHGLHRDLFFSRVSTFWFVNHRNKLGYDTLVLLTEAPAVAVEFGRPGERWLDTVRAAELRRLQAEGHFPPGSMGPKVEAALRFVEGGGKRAIIGQLFQVMDVLEGNAGTHIVPG